MTKFVEYPEFCEYQIMQPFLEDTKYEIKTSSGELLTSYYKDGRFSDDVDLSEILEYREVQ